MSGSILNNAIALMEVDSFSVVEFQNHFPPDDDTVVKGIRGVHSGCVTIEVLGHFWNLLRQFFQTFFIATRRGRGALWWSRRE
jgi:hypothetical protein